MKPTLAKYLADKSKVRLNSFGQLDLVSLPRHLHILFDALNCSQKQLEPTYALICTYDM